MAGFTGILMGLKGRYPEIKKIWTCDGQVFGMDFKPEVSEERRVRIFYAINKRPSPMKTAPTTEEALFAQSAGGRYNY